MILVQLEVKDLDVTIVKKDILGHLIGADRVGGVGVMIIQSIVTEELDDVEIVVTILVEDTVRIVQTVSMEMPQMVEYAIVSDYMFA